MRVLQHFNDRFEDIILAATTPETLFRTRSAMAKLSANELLALADGLDQGVLTNEDVVQLVMELSK
jgi:hypothetical protein